MLNPCCCISPRIGCFIFGIVDLLFSISNLSYILSNHSQWTSNKWVEVIVYVIMICLAIILIYGTVKNSIEKLQIWLVAWTIIIILIVISQVFNILSQHSRGFEDVRIGSSLASILVFAYELWVVYAFVHELKFGAAGLTYCPAQVV